MAPSFLTKSYSERAKVNNNACAKKLLELMDKKKTNLSVAIDITKKADIIRIADLLGPYICVLKVNFNFNKKKHIIYNIVLFGIKINIY